MSVAQPLLYTECSSDHRIGVTVFRKEFGIYGINSENRGKILPTQLPHFYGPSLGNAFFKRHTIY